MTRTVCPLCVLDWEASRLETQARSCQQATWLYCTLAVYLSGASLTHQHFQPIALNSANLCPAENLAKRLPALRNQSEAANRLLVLAVNIVSLLFVWAQQRHCFPDVGAGSVAFLYRSSSEVRKRPASSSVDVWIKGFNALNVSFHMFSIFCVLRSGCGQHQPAHKIGTKITCQVYVWLLLQLVTTPGFLLRSESR